MFLKILHQFGISLIVAIGLGAPSLWAGYWIQHLLGLFPLSILGERRFGPTVIGFSIILIVSLAISIAVYVKKKQRQKWWFLGATALIIFAASMFLLGLVNSAINLDFLSNLLRHSLAFAFALIIAALVIEVLKTRFPEIFDPLGCEFE